MPRVALTVTVTLARTVTQTLTLQQRAIQAPVMPRRAAVLLGLLDLVLRRSNVLRPAAGCVGMKCLYARTCAGAAAVAAAGLVVLTTTVGPLVLSSSHNRVQQLAWPDGCQNN